LTGKTHDSENNGTVDYDKNGRNKNRKVKIFKIV
jgi:hypothetical protein